MAMVKPRTLDAFQAVWTKIFADWASGIPGITQKTILADGHVCGTIGCRLLGDRHTIGYGLSPAHWGRGIASIALGLLLAEIPHRPLYATVAASNAGSIRVLTKNGFTLAECRLAPESERCLAREECLFVLHEPNHPPL
jgi:RimJ/RimL family protein N-acetyltransferase